MLLGSVLVARSAWQWPKRRDVFPLLVLGLCNSALFLGAFSFAISQVQVGLVSLCVGVNPVLMILLGALITGRRVERWEWQGVLLAVAGMALALVPQLDRMQATGPGLAVLVGGLAAFSLGSIYYNRVGLGKRLPPHIVNGWQLLVGGVLLLPVAWLSAPFSSVRFDVNLLLSLGWLVVVNSIISMLMLYAMLRRDPVEAGKWLLPPPMIGLLFAGLLLGEEVSVWMLAGGALLVAGMARAQRVNIRRRVDVPILMADPAVPTPIDIDPANKTDDSESRI